MKGKVLFVTLVLLLALAVSTANAGDIMSWSPRTIAGGVGYIDPNFQLQEAKIARYGDKAFQLFPNETNMYYSGQYLSFGGSNAYTGSVDSLAFISATNNGGTVSITTNTSGEVR